MTRRIAAAAAAFGLLGAALSACLGALPTPTRSGVPIRAAFYYGWYPGAWRQQGLDPFSRYRPGPGYYSSVDAAVVRDQVLAMQYAGIQAGIASWWGPGRSTDASLPRLLRAADGTRLKWTVYYELEGHADPTPTQIGTDLAYLGRYASDPSWLRLDGKPVLFVYADAADGCAMVQRWNAAPGRAAWYLVLKVFAGYRSCPSQPDSWHQYAPSSRTDDQSPYSFSISPGYWKATEAAPRLVRDLGAFSRAARRMVASGAQWQLITTFNEWGEGTAIEPGADWSWSYLAALHAIPDASTATPTTEPATTTTTGAGATTTTAPSTTTTSPPTTPAARPCAGAPAPPVYHHVVVVVEENRRWSDLGGPGFGAGQPYLRSLAAACRSYARWDETNPSQNSLAQYIGLTSGISNPATHNDCSPSASCRSTDDNIFRQVREAGGTARSYVDGATAPCSTGANNPAKHIPALYYYGSYTDASGPHTDHDYCSTEVVPLSQLDPGNLPTFAMVTPDLCHDGHDACGTDAVVDSWLRGFLSPILASAAYRAGDVAVFVVWDEYDPVPNLVASDAVAPAGVDTTSMASHADALRTWEQLLGLPLLQQGQLAGALGLRPSSGL